MLVSEDGKFADTWLKRNAGVDLLKRGDLGAPFHNSSLIDMKEEALLREFAAGRLNESNSTGTLFDKVAKKIQCQDPLRGGKILSLLY